MFFKQWNALILGFLLASTQAIAEQGPENEQIQVSKCLAKEIKVDHKVLAQNKQFMIIELPSTYLNELSYKADKVHCGRFLNLSLNFKGASLEQKKRFAKTILQKKLIHTAPPAKSSYEIKHQQEVEAAFKNIEPNNIWQTVSHLTIYPNRSANSHTGFETAHWLKSVFDSMVIQYGRMDTQTYFVNTPHYQQPSLVTVIGKDIKAPAIVVGAHMDTLEGYMPGAGDDGSGCASIMEMARVLLASDITFKRPIYIIWYAAEERGLLGSQHVVEEFQRQGIPVKAVLQLDMAGYRSNPSDPAMWVYRDYVDKNLTNFIVRLITTYIKVPVGYTECGYACSDHVSWNKIGIPAAFPCESSFEEHNPYIHTSGDIIDLLNLEHMTNFTKLALAFAMELALT